jgi:uncharacterized protein (TIGR02996 family)
VRKVVRTFICREGGASKFWNIELQGKSFTVNYGRVGSAGRSQTKTFADAAKAEAAHDKLVKQKLGKGYVETTGHRPADPERRALEDAVVAEPDDLAALQVYADWLSEHDDPRGEFIQVQLALEDPDRKPAERTKLQAREKELLKKHRKDWLGALAEQLPPRGAYEHWEHHFARGWIDRLHIHLLTAELAVALAREPQTQLVRELLVDDVAGNGPDYEHDPDFPRDPLVELSRALYLSSVRVLRIGGDEGFLEDRAEPDYYNHYYDLPSPDSATWELVGRMPRLEELSLYGNLGHLRRLFETRMPSLRVLQVYLADEYPLRTLAANKSLRNLTHLALHPKGCEPEIDQWGPLLALEDVRHLLTSKNLPSLTHLRLQKSDLGDRGCAEIVKSGILKRLKFLDLALGCITDQGARIHAASPDIGRLETLDLSRNCVTEDGVEALRAVVKNVRADDPHELDDNSYLFEGEME